jgi:ketosteroid isomerase-like protein
VTDVLEALRAEYAAMSRKDWDALLAVAHPDLELRTPGGGLTPEVVRGPEKARRAFEEFFSPFESVSVEPESFTERDDQVVVCFVQRAIPKGSSATVERRAAHLWTMRDGKAARLEIFPDRPAAFAAAGISERRARDS